MKDYEDEAFDELEKSLQRKVATGVTDGNKKDAALRLAREALERLGLWLKTRYGIGLVGFELDAIKAIDEALEDK
jgi:hypothetical protein